MFTVQTLPTISFLKLHKKKNKNNSGLLSCMRFLFEETNVIIKGQWLTSSEVFNNTHHTHYSQCDSDLQAGCKLGAGPLWLPFWHEKPLNPLKTRFPSHTRTHSLTLTLSPYRPLLTSPGSLIGGAGPEWVCFLLLPFFLTITPGPHYGRCTFCFNWRKAKSGRARAGKLKLSARQKKKNLFNS